MGQVRHKRSEFGRGRDDDALFEYLEREILERRQKLLNRYDMANTAGDTDLMAEVQDQIAEFNAARPAKAITRDTLLRSARARRAAEQEAVAGVRFDKDLRPEIIDKFYDEE
jgi:hypothetical protein